MNVSVIIPTYNREHLVSDAIRSVMSQTYQDFEIIVVDDGSTDKTEESVRKCSGNITFIKQNHLGPNAARNRALREAKGKYIALLDDDDLWLDFKLELQVLLLDMFSDAAYVFSDFYILKESGEMVQSGLSTWHRRQRPLDDIYENRSSKSALNLSGNWPKRDFNIYSGNLYQALLLQPYVLPSSALIKRECITPEMRFVDEDFHCGDWEFFSRLSQKYRCAYIDCETTVNRSHNDTVRLTRKSAKVQTACRVDLIQRVWRADEEFYQANKKTVDSVEAEQLLKLAKLQVLDSEVLEAGETLKRRSSLDVKSEYLKSMFLGFLIKVPGASYLLLLVLNARKRFVSLLAGSI